MLEQYSYNWTKEEKELKAWDCFLKNDPRGLCQQVSHYLKSFTLYPFFDFEVLLVRNTNQEIIAGVGVVVIGISVFKIMTAPVGPIISNGYEIIFDEVIFTILERAKSRGAFLCQLRAPILKHKNNVLKQYVLSDINSESVYFSGKKGDCLGIIKGVDGFRCTIFDYKNNQTTYDTLWAQFSKNTKRNIRKSEGNQLELRFAKSMKEVELAYKLIIEVAEFQKYPIRSWKKMQTFLCEMVKNDLCLIPCCFKDGQLKGSLILFLMGKRITYIYGGVKREERDLKVGHFLHNNMLKYSIKKGYGIYDWGVAGSVGVTRFKEGFGASYIKMECSRFWILNKTISHLWQ